MEFIYSVPLNFTTLLIFNAIPFVYYGYHAKYWWNPTKLATFDFLLRGVCALLSILILLRLINDFNSVKSIPREALFLHLSPLILTFLIAAQGKKQNLSASTAGGSASGEQSSFNPMPLNKEIKKISWNEIVIDEGLKAELISVIQLLKDPKTTKKYGIEVPKGILLNGPPGTGKTTIAKVIANSANLSFFAVQSNEIVSKWVGESEKNLSILFNAAIKHAPAVIFIDEVDSIGKTRSGNQGYSDNLLNHLLQLIDGIVSREGLYIIAATNRADLVDPALKRAGRLNKTIEVPLPDIEARYKLFILYMSKLALAQEVDLKILAEISEGKSAADIKEICNQAGLNAFKRESYGNKRRDYTVNNEDIERALQEFMQQTN